MPFRDLLKKKDKSHTSEPTIQHDENPTPGFTFMRSDTHTQEIITPPDYPTTEYDSRATPLGPDARKRTSILKGRSRATSSASTTSQSSVSSKVKDRDGGDRKRLSQRLGLRKETSSSNVPQHLPDITDRKDGQEASEGEWEQRATLLARENEKNRSSPGTPVREELQEMRELGLEEEKEARALSKAADDNIQEAIRLHEEGDLVQATQMFGRLANPNGQNNALSQVLYGLALRHGWGCAADPEKAISYLTAAASNAASVEQVALQAGSAQGGNLKGELVLAIFELANCFRHGWGVKKDAVAAKHYYETAANLGDSDAMNEVGWCYLEGFGCKKDKLTSAKYYRLAESKGNKTLGNTWIWKEKYDPPK